MLSKKSFFWGGSLVGVLLGLFFTSNAYHIKNAYIALIEAPNVFLLIGIAWSFYLALPTVILLKIITNLDENKIVAGFAASFFGIIFCIAPGILLIVLFSLE